MAELHYFSFYAPDWLSSPAVSGMLPEQEGAFIHLLATAWGNGAAEPSLPADDDTLALYSRLGARWPKLKKKILAQFTKRGGKLYNKKLSEVWRDGQKRHADAVKRGKKGAAKRWKDYGRTIDQPLPEHMDEQWQSDTKGTLVAPTALTSGPSPSPLGAEAPRSGEPRQMDDSGTSGTPTTLGDELQKYAANIIPMNRRRA